MKKFGQTLLLLFAASIVFLTGAGVTIVNYCCNSCSGQTLFMTEKHECCVDQNHNEEANSCCMSHEVLQHEECADIYTQASHCTASRLSFDIDSSSFRPQLLIPFAWVSDISIVSLLNLVPDQSADVDVYNFFESPPEIPPRDYLSLIRVLII